jgi:hypothetical protein
MFIDRTNLARLSEDKANDAPDLKPNQHKERKHQASGIL